MAFETSGDNHGNNPGMMAYAIIVSRKTKLKGEAEMPILNEKLMNALRTFENGIWHVESITDESFTVSFGNISIMFTLNADGCVHVVQSQDDEPVVEQDVDDVHAFKCFVEDYLLVHADDYDERMMDALKAYHDSQ